MKLIVFLIILICNGCCCVNDRPDFKPLPPEKLRNLRFICDGWAYKSVTKKDYEEKEECNETVLDES
jgi:hypothetical protein